MNVQADVWIGQEDSDEYWAEGAKCSLDIETTDADVDGWLSGPQATYAERECEQEDVMNGVRQGNTCIASEPGDLEWPDDWCMRCYVLSCINEARAALAGPLTRETPGG